MGMIFAKSIEEFFERKDQFHDELLFLRELFLSTGSEEKFKWNIPAYCLKNKNIAGIASFKSYVGIWFYQGVFLKDEHKKLINAQEGVTKAMRQWRFESLAEIKKDKNIILSYIEEAIENQKLGKELKPDLKKPVDIPVELQEWLKADKQFNTAFEALSLGKKRDYAEYISQAKRLETKVSRLEKIVPMVIAGGGLHDKYK